MKLIASMLIRNETDRYLGPAIASLLEFCDEVRLLDDGSTDGFPVNMVGYWGNDGSRIAAKIRERSTFFEHEGNARQELYDWTMEGEPTHVLAIDADEFVSDGAALRADLEAHPQVPVWKMWLDEVWRVEDDCLCIRTDGAWGNRRVFNTYRTPHGAAAWKIEQRKLACGREPTAIHRWMPEAGPARAQVLHFGWASETDREKRHARYAEHDQGAFHARHHLDSIMWPAERVQLAGVEWPAGLTGYKEAILLRANRLST